MQSAAGKRPPTRLRIARTLPQQHVEPGTALIQSAGPEDDGEYLMGSASMNHVFDYKSKTYS